jgi:hypothetical protein
VQIKNALKTLSQKLIIKNIALMSVAVLQLTEELWKSITRRRLLEMVLLVDVKSAGPS